MDNCLSSGRSLEEMRKRVRDVSLINSEANFVMHGWASNDLRVVEEVREESKLNSDTKADLCNQEERVLGLYWDRDLDTFSFNVGLNKIRAGLLYQQERPTKREFFSMTMSIYDPLGILSPYKLRAKLIMQNIWRSGINWEAKIRDEEFAEWVAWLKDLEEIKNCIIPRCYVPKNVDYVRTQLHVFCDASLTAFAATAYLRTSTQNEKTHVALIMAKTRVAPVKQMTVTRLELQAALLAARLAKTITDALEIEIKERIFWTDSTTVLQWIRTEPRLKQMFVVNRLGEIGELTH